MFLGEDLGTVSARAGLFSSIGGIPGQEVGEIVLSGALAANAILTREHADSCGCPVILPATPEPVPAGAARLDAVPFYHDRKYAVDRQMKDGYAAVERLIGRAE